MENAKMCSLKEEFTTLRPFITEELIGRKLFCYSEEEIQEHEKRLNYRLPEPVRNVYMHMADLFFSYFNMLRPLYRLHWDGDYIAFFDLPETSFTIGICRNDDPNTLYEWEEDVDGEEDDILYDLETSEENGDSIGLEKALKEHYKYWEKEHRKGNLRKMDGPRYQSCLDGFCIFETLFIISYNAETMDTDNFYSFFSDCAENDKKLREFFVPLSKTTELLKDENGDLIGYLSPKGDVVVYCSPWDTMFELWSYKAIDPQLLEDLKNSADVDFE